MPRPPRIDFPEVKYAYDRQGEETLYTDQNGITHAYAYDGVGRELSDSITVVSGNPYDIDTTVTSIDYGYKPCGKLQTVSDEDADGDILNQIYYVYDTNGNEATEYQSHTGAVDFSTSEYVGYGYDPTTTTETVAGTSGVTVSEYGYRPTTLQYPTTSGVASEMLTDEYTGSDAQSSTDDAINRLDSIDDGSTTTTASSTNGALTTTSSTTGDPLAAYNYLGVDTVIKEDYSVPGISLDYAGTTAGTYPGLDQFDRVVDQNWANSFGTPIDEEKEGFNAQGNVAYEQNVTEEAYSAANPSLNLKALDQVFGYIGTGELDSLAQGQITTDESGNVTVDSLGNASLVSGTQNFSQNFTLDSAGNNTQIATTGTQAGTGGDSTVTQDRQVNGANQIQNYNDDTDTSTSSWAVPGYDAAGNMTTTPQPGNETTALTCVYDAWGHLDEVLNGTTVLATYQYDGNGSLIVVDENGVTTDRYYANGQLLESIDRAPTSPTDGATYMTEQYVWSASNPNSLISRTQTTFTYSTSTSTWTASTPIPYFYLSDANNNVTAITDSSGNVLERYAYGAYGTATIYNATWTVQSSSSINNTFYFAGMQVDTQTGLSYVNARWYSTSLAIFVTTDPALSSSNLYAYALDDPTTLNDPTGLYVGATVATDSDHPVPGPCNGEQSGAIATSSNPWDPMDTRTDGAAALAGNQNNAMAAVIEAGLMSDADALAAYDRVGTPYTPAQSSPAYVNGSASPSGGGQSAETNQGTVAGYNPLLIPLGGALSRWGSLTAIGSRIAGAEEAVQAFALRFAVPTVSLPIAAAAYTTFSANTAGGCGDEVTPEYLASLASIPALELDATGRVHSNDQQLPKYVPGNWTRTDLEDSAAALQQSIKNRRAEQNALGNSTGKFNQHESRITKEQELLNQILKKLSGS